MTAVAAHPTYHFDLPTGLIDQLHALLGETYWAAKRPRAQVERAVRNALCVHARIDDQLVGFARLITDFATHGYLADVIVHPDWRGRGIGTTLVRKLIEHDAVATCILHLNTKDAHAVYRPLGFRERDAMVRPARAAWPSEAGGS